MDKDVRTQFPRVSIGRACRRAAALRKADSGAAALEFAIAFPIFMFMVYALFEFSRVFWAQSTLDYAVEEAARFAMVNPTANNVTIENVATAAMTGLVLNSVTMNAVVSNAGVATITATYTYDMIVPITALSNYVLQATISMPVVQ